MVDIYDAFGTQRPYKAALSREHSLEILREEAERGWWDRKVIETLMLNRRLPILPTISRQVIDFLTVQDGD